MTKMQLQNSLKKKNKNIKHQVMNLSNLTVWTSGVVSHMILNLFHINCGS